MILLVAIFVLFNLIRNKNDFNIFKTGKTEENRVIIIRRKDDTYANMQICRLEIIESKKCAVKGVQHAAFMLTA